MKLMKKIRQYWHDTYYFFARDRGVKFAMTCKEAAEQIDLGLSKSLIDRLRFYLHLSLCQGCKNYLSLTGVLRRAIKNAISKNENPVRLESLNNELLVRHCKKN